MAPSRASTSASQAGHLDWTANKCGRLLRHLTTSLSALRKDMEGQNNVAKPKPTAPKRKYENTDDDWTAVPRKTVRRTYSSRGRLSASLAAGSSTQQDELSPYSLPGPSASTTPMGGIHMVTPVAQRLSGVSITPVKVPDPSEPGAVGQCWHLKCRPDVCEIDQERIQTRRNINQGKLKHYDAIYQHLDALLRATSVQAPGTAAPKSLMAMCLRKIPDFIARREIWEQEGAEENGTGTVKHRVECLLSDILGPGIRLVEEAIAEGLIERDFALLLARVCDQVEAFSDRGRLLQVVVLHTGRRKNGESTGILSTPWAQMGPILTKSPHKWTCPFTGALMTEAFDREHLPASWIFTPSFHTIWSAAVTDVTTEHPKHGTIDFIARAIQALATSSAVPSKYMDALTVMTTMSIMGQNTLSSIDLAPEVRARITKICKRVEIVLRSCLAEVRESRVINDRRNACLLRLALFFAKGFLAAPSPEDDGLLASFWPLLKMQPTPSDPLYGGTLQMVSTIAQSYKRRPTDDQPRTCLDRLFERLSQACPRTVSLKKMRVEAFFYLAEKSRDMEDYAHAERLAIATNEEVCQIEFTTNKSRAFAGFRWDEGISEWVTATPLVVRTKTLDMPSRDLPAVLEDIFEDYGSDTESEAEDMDSDPFMSSPPQSQDTPASNEAGSQDDNRFDDAADSADELSFCVADDDQEHLPTKQKAARKSNPVKNRRRSRPSLSSIQAVPKGSKDAYDDGLSDDELGM